MEIEYHAQKVRRGLEKQNYYCNSITIADEKTYTTLEKPNKGDVISREQHKALREETIQKFRQMYGEGVDTSE